ncbi:MAG: hypothetical protein LUM44_24335 [Pyrinomonadaceae bacterium]|nr:hypothetical protein [Pyrinomonadaceae bacterium]
MMGNFENNDECVEFFCRAVSHLDAISAAHIERLLNIAAIAARESNNNTTAPEKLIEQLKTTAEEANQNAQKQKNELYENVKNSLADESENSFCKVVERKVLVVLDNSIANQQQLNVIGNAILSQAATLLLTPKTKE